LRCSMDFSMCSSQSSRMSSTGMTNPLSSVKCPMTKAQCPKNDQVPMTNRAFFGHWSLGLLWSLRHWALVIALSPRQYRRSNRLPLHHSHNIPLLLKIKHHQRELLFHEQGDGGQVHDAQLVAQDLVVGYFAIHFGGGFLLGIGGVNTIHL